MSPSFGEALETTTLVNNFAPKTFIVAVKLSPFVFGSVTVPEAAVLVATIAEPAVFASTVAFMVKVAILPLDNAPIFHKPLPEV